MLILYLFSLSDMTTLSILTKTSSSSPSLYIEKGTMPLVYSMAHTNGASREMRIGPPRALLLLPTTQPLVRTTLLGLGFPPSTVVAASVETAPLSPSLHFSLFLQPTEKTKRRRRELTLWNCACSMCVCYTQLCV